jgi:hypothetical protein
MSAPNPTSHGEANPRFRGPITALLMFMIVVMIVRDVFARRREARRAA